MENNNQSIIEKLNTKYNRKIFLITISLVILLLFFLQYFVIPFLYSDPTPEFKVILQNILSSLFSTIVATLGITALIFYLTPPIMHRSQFNFVSPHLRDETLKSARENTHEWWFSGGSGRYTRIVTLPKLSVKAKNTNNHKNITLLILDPSNTQLIENYIEYKKSLKTGRTDPWWNIDNVKSELYSFILAAYYWENSEPLFNIELGLKDSFSIFRIDMSSDFVVVTKEDPREPALRFDKNTFLYYSYKQELFYSMKQANNISLGNKTGKFTNHYNISDIKNIFKNMKIKDSWLTDKNIDKVLISFETGTHQYE